MNNKPIPFNTGKVLIGSAYRNVSRPPLSREEIFWQSVLLGEYEAQRIQRVQAICYAVLVVCFIAIVAITLGE